MNSYLEIPSDKIIDWLLEWRFSDVQEKSGGITFSTYDFNDNKLSVILNQDKGRVYLHAAYAPIELLDRMGNFRKKLLEENFGIAGAAFAEMGDKIYAKGDFRITGMDEEDELALWDGISALKLLANRLCDDINRSLDPPSPD